MTEECQDWKIVEDLFKKSWPVLSAFAGKIIEFVRTSEAYSKVHFLKKVYDMVKSGRSLPAISSVLMNVPEKYRTIAAEVNCCLHTCDAKGAESFCLKLEKMMQNQFNILSVVMFMNALNAFSQSVVIWHTLWKYQIKTYERKMDRVKQYMEEAVNLLAIAIDEITQQNCQTKIERALQHLEDAKVILQDICDDIEDGVSRVKTIKNNSIQQSAVNAISLITNVISVAIFPQAAVAGWGAILASASVSIHGACTIRNLIATGEAQELLNQLKVQLATIGQTEAQRQLLESRLRALVM